MELTTNPRRQQDTAQIVPYNPTAPHVASALKTMGDEVEFFRPYVPANLYTVFARQINAMRLGKTRQVSLVMAAYGTEPVLRCVREHLIWLKMTNLYNWSDNDVTQLATAILRTEEARLLDFISLLGFFKDVADGKINLFGATQRDVMQALQKYYGGASLRDYKMRKEIETERRINEPRELLTQEEINELKKKAELWNTEK